MKNSVILSNKLATELDLPAGRFFIATDYTNEHKSDLLISYIHIELSILELHTSVEITGIIQS